MSGRLAQSAERMTVEQYLGWAERQPDGRYELVDGAPQRMWPELNRHPFVEGAAYRAFVGTVRAEALDCVVLPDGATVVIHDRKAREPDLSVVCGASLDLDSVTADAPNLVVEVTSPSTILTDTGEKLIEYFSLGSVQHYLLTHALERTVVHHHRTEGGKIETSIARDGPLRFDPPGMTVEIALFSEDLPPMKAN